MGAEQDDEEEEAKDETIEEHLRMEDIKLDERFTEAQLEVLLGLKEKYRFAEPRERREIAQSTAESFRDEILKSGKDLSTGETDNLINWVKIWFSQRGRSRREPVRWTFNWTGRQVFYRENKELVAKTQSMLYSISGAEKLEDDELLEMDLEFDDPEEEAPRSKDPTPFYFFQRALSAEWKALSDSEQEAYEEKAMQWRMEGPSEEARKALAEKEACRVLRFLAQDLYRQMGVRLFMLASYEDSNNEMIAVSLDFNNELGSNGQSYKLAQKSYLDRIDLLNNYASFVKKTAPAEEEVVDRKAAARDIQFQVNERGEAVLPDPNKAHPILKPHVYCPTLVRKFMHYDWARAQGQTMHRKNGPSWLQISHNLSLYINAEYLPDDVDLPLCDPGVYEGTDRVPLQRVFFW
ncbi:hypothetical protein NMY22_g5602 [Coprinellus aureogranulatus]|nr:hypothetical protein NMY22_g5602 [Coprinellus aureogranulatus]